MLSLNKINFFPLKKYFIEILILINLLIQSLTGFLMLFYYIPSMEKGYESTIFIIRDVPLGYYFFNIHFWGAIFILILIILLIFKIIFYKLYHPPKEILWIFTFILFLLFSFAYFTGILLPMENNFYWQVERIMEILKEIPVLNSIYSFLFGNFIINKFVHIRFYIFHSFLIPSFIIFSLFLIFLNFEREKISPFYLHYLFILFLILFGILLTLSILFPFKISEIYEPFKTPKKIYLPFFLLPIYFLKIYLPKKIFGLIFLILNLLIFILPWIDKREPVPIYKNKISLSIFSLFIILIFLTGIFGFFKL